MTERIRYVFGSDPGQQNQTAVALQQELLQQTQTNFSLAFPQQQSQRGKILQAFQKLLALENMRAALFPKRRMRREEIASLIPQAKNTEIPLERLKEWGVIPSFTKNLYLHASLYVLPGPLPFARVASSQSHEYALFRPHVQKSLSCRLPNGDPAYYVELGAFGFVSAMAVGVKQKDEAVHHYHLADKCLDNHQTALQTTDVAVMDGMKIYLPIQIEEEGRLVDKTFVLSTTITIWAGLKGWGIEKLGGQADNEVTYGSSSFSEILAVLRRLP